MEKAIKRTAEFIGYICSFIISPKIPSLVKGFITHIYTGYYSRRFGKWGKGSVLGYPLRKLSGAHAVVVGKECQIARHATITAWQNEDNDGKTRISIGDGCHIGEYVHITASNNITIGNNLLTGSNVLITDNSHGLTDDLSVLKTAPALRPIYSKGKVVIGNNVWIGNNVCILPGVEIGDGVIVAANSCVTHDIPPYCIVAGQPARIIKNLSV